MALVAAVVVLAALFAPGEEHESHLGVGVNAGYLFLDASFTPRDRDLALAAAQRAGVRLARVDALWERIELNPPAAGRHDYDWTYADEVAGELARRGIRWWPVLDYAPRWATASTAHHAPPRRAVDFAAWAAAFASRYGSEGTFWREHSHLPALPVEDYEIWNEPNVASFWAPHPDPAAYAALYTVTRQAIRDADPKATVVTGGMAASRTWVNQLVEASPSLRGEIDGVGVHPYGRTPHDVVLKVARVRDALARADLEAVPLVVTEVGWKLRPPGDRLTVPDSRRAANLRAIADELADRACGVEQVLIFSWASPQRDPNGGGDWYGLIDRPDRPTASSRVWARLEHDPPALRGSRRAPLTCAGLQPPQP